LEGLITQAIDVAAPVTVTDEKLVQPWAIADPPITGVVPEITDEQPVATVQIGELLIEPVAALIEPEDVIDNADMDEDVEIAIASKLIAGAVVLLLMVIFVLEFAPSAYS
jgi:hypothetical protein